MAEGKRVAVTGATGFIGSNLCHHLVKAGYRVRALVRRPAAASALSRAGIEIIPGDLADSDSLVRLAAGCDSVVHCAGAVRGRTAAEFRAANAAGTANLMAAVKQSEFPARVLLISSLAAREPGLSDYAASKREAEEVALAVAEVATTIIRPPPVYGPGDRELLPLFKAMARGYTVIPGSPENRLSLIHIDDLVAAAAAWLSLEHVPRDTFTIADPALEGYRWSEIIATAERVVGRRIRVLPAQPALLRLIARINLSAAGVFGYAPMLTPGKVRELLHPDWHCDNQAVSEAFSWEPAIAFEAGLARTLEGSSGR